MPHQADLQKLILIYERRLQLLKEQQALHGLNTPPEILLEIEDIETRLADLLATLASLTNPSVPPGPGRVLTQAEVAAQLPHSTDDAPPARQTHSGGVNISGISGSTITIGNISTSVTAGGDIVGGDKTAIGDITAGGDTAAGKFQLQNTGYPVVQNFHLKNIRTLLMEGFTEEEIRRLCFDATEFRPVYEQLAEAMGKDRVVDKLIESAERRELLDTLLAQAETLNPARYKKHQPYQVEKHLSHEVENASAKALSTLQAALAQWQRQVEAKITALTGLDDDEKADLKKTVERLAREVAKGEQAESGRIERWLNTLGATAPDILEVTVASMQNPLAGVGLGMQKINDRIKVERPAAPG